MPRAVIADDEPHLAAFLQQQLLRLWPELEIVHVAANGFDAADAIARFDPDLAFLDIQMPGMTGLEVAQGIEGATRVVFVTAHDRYALQAFEQAALDYVLKPVGTERLARTLDRLKAACAPPSPDARLSEVIARLMASAPKEKLRYIRASQGELTHQVPVEDVRFFQAEDKYTVVHTIDAERLIRTTIAELATQLDPTRFWRIHRATLINVAHLEGTRRDETSRLYVRIRGHARELPVSRAYVHLFKPM